MRRVSIRDLHINTSEFVREASEGAVIVIERRGEPVAELRPLSGIRRMPAETRARIFAEMETIWSRLPQGCESTGEIEEDRNR